ncbi:MAG: dipeptidase [Cyanobacteria bacterium P01_G01_bin.4]
MKPVSLATAISSAIATVSFATTCVISSVAADEIAELHDRAITIDSHIDWPFRQTRVPDFDPGIRNELGPPNNGQWDIPRMEEGGLDAVFLAVFVPQRERNPEGLAAAKALADEQIDLTSAMVDTNEERVEFATSPADIVRIEAAGKRAILMGIENGYALGGDLENVEYFYDRGVRYLTLTHSTNNSLADSSTDDQQEWDGLSPFGTEVVREMNRLGMMVDISHVHDDTFWDVIALTEAPVIASHSSARSLRDVPRNMTDDMLRAVRDNGGVVQVCLLGDYIKDVEQSPEREAALAELEDERAALVAGALSDAEVEALLTQFRAINERYPENKPTVADAVEHIDHMVEIMGIDHVGIGSDFDGGGGLSGINDVSEMFNITQELAARGYSEADIQKLWGGNLMRVFGEVQEAAEAFTGST